MPGEIKEINAKFTIAIKKRNFVQLPKDKIKAFSIPKFIDMKTLISTSSFGGNFIVRLIVGLVFLSEGIQKFVYPALRGTGRFTEIGLPAPEIFGPFVGTIEIICGLMILSGLFTRVASITTYIIMLVAIASTKAEILSDEGFWSMMHAIRTDWAMLLGSFYLILYGGGKYSIDLIIFNKKFR